MAGNILLNLAQQDQIDDVRVMLRAIQQLMVVTKDLSAVDRGDLVFLLSYFSGRLQEEQDPDEQDVFKRCLSAAIELISPDDGLAGVDRDELSTLLFYLINLLDKALSGDL